MKKSLVIVALAIAVGLALAVGYRFGRAARTPVADISSHADALYLCPMHPQVVSDRPGQCPICQMSLVKRTDEPPAIPAAGGPPRVEGLASVALSARKRELLGARTAKAEIGPFARTVRAVGLVAVDERRIQHVHTKIQGWIEHLHAGAVGEAVRRGDPLLTIYSPELLASQREYLVALDQLTRIPTTSPGVAADAELLVDAAKRRLLLQDMTPAQISSLASTREEQRVVTLYSPVSGTITGRNVSHGERIESATSLLDIADLEKVWITADVYESELPFVHVGQQATIRLAYLPARSFAGRVSLVSPIVDTVTRTIKLRVELDNRDLTLRPGMFADVEVSSDLGRRLFVPKEAVLRSGTRDVVFVSPEIGSFEPREVEVGLELPDRWEIRKGLAEGDNVLAAATFFIDAESKLKAALAKARP